MHAPSSHPYKHDTRSNGMKHEENQMKSSETLQWSLTKNKA